MSVSLFRRLLWLLAFGFALSFIVIVIPPLIAEPDILGAFAAGFVNPYSTGYSLDVIFCWWILVLWIVFEAVNKQVKHGWIAALLGVVPGVAVGFAAYLLIRMRQLQE